MDGREDRSHAKPVWGDDDISDPLQAVAANPPTQAGPKVFETENLFRRLSADLEAQKVCSEDSELPRRRCSIRLGCSDVGRRSSDAGVVDRRRPDAVRRRFDDPRVLLWFCRSLFAN